MCSAWAEISSRLSLADLGSRRKLPFARQGFTYRSEQPGAPYLARFSRDVGGDRWSPFLNLQGYRSECSGIPHLAKNERDTRISCTQPHPMPRVRLSLRKAA
jgi:hypothetical protein